MLINMGIIYTKTDKIANLFFCLKLAVGLAFGHLNYLCSDSKRDAGAPLIAWSEFYEK